MRYTIAEKILLAHTDKKDIRPGEFIDARVDLCLGNDITAPLAISEFRKHGFKKVFNKNKIALIPDHFTPAKDAKSANQCRMLLDFTREHKLKNYFEVGSVGIEHVLLPEKKIVLPGDLVIGADSHTCTYGALGAYSTGVGSTDLARAFVDGKCWFKVPASIKFVYTGKKNKWVCGKDLILYTIGMIGVDGALYRVMEFAGEAAGDLSMDERFSMSNMAIEAGARAGLFEADAKTLKYVRPAPRKVKIYKSDKGALYERVIEIDVSKINPQVSLPSLPSNAVDVASAKNILIDQAVIGSCTNGRLSDMEIAARLLRGKKVRSGVRLIILPGTQKVYSECVKLGYAKIFIEAGGVFSTPTCGPCLGGHAGILAEGERCISTTNRNFVGRMGHPKSEVYLSSPAVAAASAVKGRIAHPGEIS